MGDSVQRTQSWHIGGFSCMSGAIQRTQKLLAYQGLRLGFIVEEIPRSLGCLWKNWRAFQAR
jgi:hypothetical protein